MNIKHENHFRHIPPVRHAKIPQENPQDETHLQGN